MSALELKISPVLLVVTTALLMKVTAMGISGVRFSSPFRGIIVACIVVAGLIISLYGILEFQRANTTVNPTKPQTASALVMAGIYGVTRNPMYLRFLFVLIGWALWLGNLLASLFLPAFILFMNRFQITPEERALSRIFGTDFQIYCSKVRRWI